MDVLIHVYTDRNMDGYITGGLMDRQKYGWIHNRWTDGQTEELKESVGLVDERVGV